MKKIALISGVSGQDGAFLANLLLENNYRVIGTSRDISRTTFPHLEKLKIKNEIELVSLLPTDLSGMINVVKKYRPNEIYNLSGQSSVGLSFEQPHGTLESIVMGTLNFLEAIRFVDKNIKFYNAGSSEMFGSSSSKVNELTRLAPKSPYAVAKAASFFEVANYREAYGLFAVTGILFNHESPFRGDNFVTKKIIQSAVRISRGSTERLQLGNIKIKRDWGWAPEYMVAVWKMLQTDLPKDYIIASGKTHSLEYFLDVTFKHLKLNWQDHVEIKDFLKRPSDLDAIYADPSNALVELNWQAKVGIESIVERMIQFEIEGKIELL